MPFLFCGIIVPDPDPGKSSRFTVCRSGSVTLCIGFLSESLVFCEKMSEYWANEQFAQKNGRFAHSLNFGKQPEQFTHISHFGEWPEQFAQ